MIKTLSYATHTAHIDPMTGEGLLVLPHPASDLHGFGASLHEAGWDHVIRELDALGWEPTEAEDGFWLSCGLNRKGREVIGLYGREPIDSDPTQAHRAAALAELALLAGL